jgi:hypothetical protein
MKKRSNLFYLLVLFIISSFGCVECYETEYGRGPVVTRELILPDFHSLELSGSGNVFLTQGDEQSVVVEGQENIIDLLDLKIVNGSWKIRFNQNVGRHQELNFHITIPQIRKLAIAGSGSIVANNTIYADDLYFKIAGSGDVDADVEVVRVFVDVAGSGDINLTGNAEKGSYKIAGSGDIHSFGLFTNRTSAQISGSGNVETTVVNYLNVQIAGSGNVYYKGDPSIDVSIAGSGKLKKVK